MIPQAVTLSELTAEVAKNINLAPKLQERWVIAELSDVKVRPGSHCYLELVEKDDAGKPITKIQGTIWANIYARLSAKFRAATGNTFASGMKVMILVTVNYHPLYGLAANVKDIEPQYTMGDLLIRRRQILDRLQREGILEMNRSLVMPDAPLRVAIISAPNAAGYGDFVHEMQTVGSQFRFTLKLFPAIVQGEKTPETIIAALTDIAAEEEQWDCVVIIRGGGATTDFAAFESYELAANIAQFPLPIITGIGHEKDVTLLDFVANMSVKTPTAVADTLIEMAQKSLDKLRGLAQQIGAEVISRLNGNNELLARAETSLKFLPGNVIKNALRRSDELTETLGKALRSVTLPQLEKLAKNEAQISASVEKALSQARKDLETKEKLIAVLSPQATLSRGYSITRYDGHAIMNASDVPSDAEIETTLADGIIVSIKKK